MQVGYLEQPAVCRHKVPSIESNDVSRNQFCYRQFLFFAITNDSSSCGNLFLDLLNGMPGLEFHEEVQQQAQHNDGDDDQSANGVAEYERYGAGDEKDDDEGISK